MDIATRAPNRATLRREIGLEHMSSYFGVLPGVVGLMARADILVMAGALFVLLFDFLSYESKRAWLLWTVLNVILSTVAYFSVGCLLGWAGYDLPHIQQPTFDLLAYGIVFGAVVSKLEQGLANLVLAADGLLRDGR